MTGHDLIGQAAWTALTAAAGLSGAVGYARWIEPRWLQIVERDLPIANLPFRWHGKRLVQLSDLHVGPDVSDAYLIDAFRCVGSLLNNVDWHRALWNSFRVRSIREDPTQGSPTSSGYPGLASETPSA